MSECLNWVKPWRKGVRHQPCSTLPSNRTVGRVKRAEKDRRDFRCSLWLAGCRPCHHHLWRMHAARIRKISFPGEEETRSAVPSSQLESVDAAVLGRSSVVTCVSETTTSATATSRSARLPVLKNRQTRAI